MKPRLLLLHLIWHCVLITLANISLSEAVLEPAGVLYVCLGGGWMVTCNTSAYFLQWSFSGISQTRGFQIDGIRTTSAPLSVHSTVLNISRSLPLISTVSTDTTTADFNETVITYSEHTISASVLSSASVQIIVVGSNGDNVIITPHMDISQWFETNGIAVFLEWVHKNGVSYSVSVDPEVAIDTGQSSAQLSLSYNLKYNISVTASLCGRNSTSFHILNLKTCPEPHSVSDDSVRVSSYRNPTIEGTIITFSCPDGLTLTGSNASTCTGNGEWEPQLIRIRCKADCNPPIVKSNVSVNYSSTLEDSLLTFQCDDALLPKGVFTARCYRNGSWIPNPFNHVCATSSATNCGDPSQPSDGYLEPYISTSLGARVYIVHVCQNGQLATEEIGCGLNREWETINGSSCVVLVMHKPMVNLLASISGSLGALLAVAVVVCGILFVVIIVISRKRGMVVSSSEEQGKGESKSKSQNPEYEEVMASRNEAVRDEQKELEMMQNVAYGPLKL